MAYFSAVFITDIFPMDILTDLKIKIFLKAEEKIMLLIYILKKHTSILQPKIFSQMKEQNKAVDNQLFYPPADPAQTRVPHTRHMSVSLSHPRSC